MTATEFNTKYKNYIPEGWDGLQFDILEVTNWLDSIMENGLVNIPGFKLHQIKLKFGMARFYFETDWNSKWLEMNMEVGIENEINRIIKRVNETVGTKGHNPEIKDIV